MNLYIVNINNKTTLYEDLNNSDIHLSDEQLLTLEKNKIVSFFSEKGEVTILLSDTEENQKTIAESTYRNPIKLNDNHQVKISHYNNKSKLHSPLDDIPSQVNTIDNIRTFHKNGILDIKDDKFIIKHKNGTIKHYNIEEGKKILIKKEYINDENENIIEVYKYENKKRYLYQYILFNDLFESFTTYNKNKVLESYINENGYYLPSYEYISKNDSNKRDAIWSLNGKNHSFKNPDGNYTPSSIQNNIIIYERKGKRESLQDKNGNWMPAVINNKQEFSIWYKENKIHSFKDKNGNWMPAKITKDGAEFYYKNNYLHSYKGKNNRLIPSENYYNNRLERQIISFHDHGVKINPPYKENEDGSISYFKKGKSGKDYVYKIIEIDETIKIFDEDNNFNSQQQKDVHPFPSIIRANGDKEFYLNNQLHSFEIEGKLLPAIIKSDGEQIYYKKGKLCI
jgi:hypothetical protein